MTLDLSAMLIRATVQYVFYGVKDLLMVVLSVYIDRRDINEIQKFALEALQLNLEMDDSNCGYSDYFNWLADIVFNEDSYSDEHVRYLIWEYEFWMRKYERGMSDVRSEPIERTLLNEKTRASSVESAMRSHRPIDHEQTFREYVEKINRALKGIEDGDSNLIREFVFSMEACEMERLPNTMYFARGLPYSEDTMLRELKYF